MKTKINFKRLLIWVAVVLTFALLSPKWVFAPAAWIAPAILLALMNLLRFWKGVLFGWLALVVSGFIGGYGVLPFPGVFFIIMTLFISMVKVIPYALTRWITPQFNGKGYSIFVFPCALVASEYIDSFGGGGTWGSLAYTQFDNHLLIQLASVGGIWCITFLIGWFASLANWVIDQKFNRSIIQRPVLLFASVFAVAMLFGLVKINSFLQPSQDMVRIAGITANNASLVKAMYEDYFDKKVDIDPDELTQSSPELQELQKGFVKFIENPRDIRFTTTHRKLAAFHDSLLLIADREANAGARLIAFSEGLMITTKEDEDVLVQKGIGVAKKNNVYLVLSMASLLPGTIEMGSKFMENKALLINPSGEVETTFFKNRPVPVVEPSIPGNGEVPVIKTPFGKVAISICYDADFPSLIRKAGLQQADMLILPSGDWKEISPYHGRMAVFRGIENGLSLFRIVSGATSMAADSNGRMIATSSFYDKGERVLVAYVPARRQTTLYGMVGDLFAWICVTGLVLFCVMIIVLKRKPAAKLAPFGG